MEREITFPKVQRRIFIMAKEVTFDLCPGKRVGFGYTEVKEKNHLTKYEEAGLRQTEKHKAQSILSLRA